jgi:hypothetical protein
MFSGGGLAFADGAIKRGDFAVTPAPIGGGPESWPDLTGLSCRFEEFRAAQGLILSLIVLPAEGADLAAFRALTEEIVALAEASPDAGRPVPAQGPEIRWPPQGVELETHTTAGNLLRRRIAVLAKTLIVYLIFRANRPIGSFVPARYMRQVVENSDYRKYDDGLRMILDCTPALADVLEQRLAAATGVARYGLFRQDAAMMTCFTPSPLRADHVHFVDGARGGYAAAATALKTAFAEAAKG